MGVLYYGIMPAVNAMQIVKLCPCLCTLLAINAVYLCFAIHNSELFHTFTPATDANGIIGN